jgi:uncharacterized repeat protein (TIGR02543 family)
MKITGLTKNKKFVTMISFVALLGMITSAPAQAADSKSKRIIELANPANVVVTPSSTSLAITFSRVANASSYTVRVFQGSNDRLVGSARTLFNPGNSVTGLTPSTDYKVSVQAIGNGTTYSNSDDSRKVKTRTTGAANTPFNITWVSNCPNAQLCTPASGGQNFYIATQAITIPASNPSQPGFTFTGWLSNNPNVTSTSFPTTPRPTYGAVTFTAQWSPNPTNNVVWTLACPDTNPCGSDAGGSRSYTQGLAITAPTSNPSTPGFTFTGWSSSNVNVSAANFPTTPVSTYGDVVFTAQWTPLSYSITWDSNCIDVCQPSPDGSPTYTAGQPIGSSASDPVQPGRTFTGWLSSNLPVTTSPTVTPASPYGAITFTAQWTINSYAIRWDSACNDVTVCSPATGGSTTYTVGQPFTPASNPTESGREFVRWTSNNTAAASSSTVTPQSPYGDIVFTAEWRANPTHNVVWTLACPDANPCGSDAGGSSSYTEGLGINAPTSNPSASGWTFTGWTSNNPNVSAANFPTTPVSTYGDVVFTAQWVSNTRNIYWIDNCPTPSDCTPSSGGQVVYIMGETITTFPTHPSNGGYTFTGWTAQFAANGDLTNTAVWVQDTPPNNGGGGPGDPNNGGGGGPAPDPGSGAFTFTFNYNCDNPCGAGGTNSSTRSFNSGDSIGSFPTLPVRTGTQEFAGWLWTADPMDNGSLNEAELLAIAWTGNATFTAQWTYYDPFQF